MLQVSRDKLAHLGVCVGKLTHTGKFRLTIACLDLLAQHAKYKVRHCTVYLSKIHLHVRMRCKAYAAVRCKQLVDQNVTWEGSCCCHAVRPYEEKQFQSST